MDLYNELHNFLQIIIKDNIKVGDYIIDLDSGEFDRGYDILRISEYDAPYYCATTCAKVLANNSIVKYDSTDENEFILRNPWHVIVPKEYYHMIDKVLVFS